MKAILISIKPKYVVDILNGKKTIEIRKVMPKCDLPIDVYIYCTKDKERLVRHRLANGGISYTLGKEFSYYDDDLNGKVVAKFTLNKVEEILTDETDLYGSGVKDIRYFTLEKGESYLCEKSCLEYRELKDYLGNNKGYAWHISNLEIFKLKELREFDRCILTEDLSHDNITHIHQRFRVIKVPQSWCYVEVE